MTHKRHAFYLLLLFLLLFMNSVIWWTLIPQKSWSRTKSCWSALSWEILVTFKIFNWILLFPCLFHYLLYKKFSLLDSVDKIKVSMSNEEELLWLELVATADKGLDRGNFSCSHMAQLSNFQNKDDFPLKTTMVLCFWSRLGLETNPIQEDVAIISADKT